MVTTAVVLISSHAAYGQATGDFNGPGPLDCRSAAFTPVANKPLLLHVLDSLERAGVDDVVLAAETRVAQLVKELLPATARPRQRITHLAFDELTLTATFAEVARLRGAIPLVVHRADSLGRQLDRHLGSASPGEHDALLLVQERHDPSGAVLSLNGHLAALPSRGPAGASWSPAGAAVFGSGVGEAARSLGCGANHDLQLVALAQRLASADGHLEARPVDDWLRLNGQPGGLLEANRFTLASLPRDVPPDALSGDSEAQGNVVIHPTAQLESSVVRGPAVIGARARLTDAYVGPYSSIGEDVVIDGAEVEHSIILTGARIRHLGHRLEGSIIGANADIFRDFRLPKALRLQVGAGAVVSVH